MMVNISVLDVLLNTKFRPSIWRSLYVASCPSLHGGEEITATKLTEEIFKLYHSTGSWERERKKSFTLSEL
jgi:hypothetical protein